MTSKKTILVTGGAGYIGSHTVVELINNGFEPLIVDDLRNANRIVLDGIRKITGLEITFLEIDICNFDAFEQVFKSYKIDGIIHFAAYKAVGESVVEPIKYYKNNIIGLLNTAELALKYNVSNFVFSSSCTVYGEPSGVKEVDENSAIVEAQSPYGNTKIIGEQILKDVQKSNNQFKVINLRYFNPVGAHPSALIGEFPLGKPNNLLPFVTQTAIGKHEYLTVFGNDYPTADGTCIRDYIHVCDLAAAHVSALNFLFERNKATIEAINIGTGKGTSILEVINIFEQKTGQKLNWKFGNRRSGDVVEIFANADKSNKILKWKANYSVQDAIEHAWKWEQKLNENA